MKIAIIGAGAWGSALAIQAASRGHSVTLWARRKEAAREIHATRKVPYLQGIQLAPEIQVTADLAEAIASAELLTLAVPSHVVRGVAEQLAPIISKKPILNLAKGIEAGTHLRMSEVVAETIGKNDYAVLSGPSFAHDVARGQPTAVVVAARTPAWAERVQRELSGPTLRLYTSSDVTGVELGGALKNIIAIAAGASDGLALGESSRAALITRGLAELVRVGETLGGKRETFFGLSGMGDLVLTCGSEQSRNHQVGRRLARGEKLEKITASMNGIAEGVRNARAFHQLAEKRKIDAPIIAATYRILYEEVTPREALEALMARELKKE